ncbi:unnamed protein product, partial [Prorocentrum cordatum]
MRLLLIITLAELLLARNCPPSFTVSVSEVIAMPIEPSIKLVFAYRKRRVNTDTVSSLGAVSLSELISGDGRPRDDAALHSASSMTASRVKLETLEHALAESGKLRRDDQRAIDCLLKKVQNQNSKFKQELADVISAAEHQFAAIADQLGAKQASLMNDAMAIIHKSATASTADFQSDNARDQLAAKDENSTTADHQIAYVRDQITANGESDLIHTNANLLLEPTPAAPVDTDAALSSAPAPFDVQRMCSLIDSPKSKWLTVESQLQTLLARQERHLQELSSLNTVKQTMISEFVGSADVQNIPSQMIELGTIVPSAGDSLNDFPFFVLDLIWSSDAAECVD